jgi:hypothetical protein
MLAKEITTMGMIDYGGPKQCLVRWKSNDDQTQGTDLFICSHGGWDKKSTTKVPAGAEYLFYGAKDDTITSGECLNIMKSGNARNQAQSMAGPDATVWDYTISEFKSDWEQATAACKEAKEKHGVQYDVVMVKDKWAGKKTIRVSDIFEAFPGYQRYHHMACRV